MGNEAMTPAEYLQRKHIEYKRRGETAVFNCPFCQDRERKGGMSLSDGSFNCLHLNNCGAKGSFYDFQKRMGDTPEKSNREVFFNQTRKQYSRPKTEMRTPTSNVAAYLHARGFTDETIAHFRFGAENDDTVMIPYYKGEQLVNVKYRSITDKKKMRVEKDAEPTLFNRDQITDEQLVICEGEYDCAALHQYGIESVSVPNGASGMAWLEVEWDYIDTFSEIYICMDNDEAGRKAAREIALRVGEWRCKNVVLPKKDANECLMAGYARADILAAFSAASDFKPETLVGPMFFHEKVQNVFRQGSKLFGIKTPWEGVNAILKGWRDGELTVWSGRNGSGKSTILNQVFIGLAAQDVRTCIYSGEMPPERYLRWAVIQHLQNSSPPPERVHDSLYWMDKHVYILNITAIIAPDKLLADFEYAARRYAVKHFIVDSLMKISFKAQDEYHQQQEFVSKLCNFVQKFHCHIHLVAHPRKTDSDEDETGKVDIKGSSHITDLCSNVIVLHRVSEKKKAALKKTGVIPADMKLYIKKNREFGVEGSVNMIFNEETKSFTE